MCDISSSLFKSPNFVQYTFYFNFKSSFENKNFPFDKLSYIKGIVLINFSPTYTVLDEYVYYDLKIIPSINFIKLKICLINNLYKA